MLNVNHHLFVGKLQAVSHCIDNAKIGLMRHKPSPIVSLVSPFLAAISALTSDMLDTAY